jgi:hypothetical protein
MSGSVVINLPAALGPAQRGLLTYVGTWSQLSLSQARLDPFSAGNLPPSMREGLASGILEPEGWEPFSASAYVRRAETYESALLVGLGVDAAAIDSFVHLGIPYGDYFAEPLHPWQEETRFAERLIRQMTDLHDALAQARERLELWKRSGISRKDGKGGEEKIGTFHILHDEFGLHRFLAPPLNALRGMLETNVGRARWVIQRRGLTEEGLLEYFRVPHPGWSGIVAREEPIDFAALETKFPPPVGS